MCAPAPATNGGSAFWTSPGRCHLLRQRARLHQQPWRRHLLNVTRPPPRLPSSPHRRCSSFPRAAMALLFIVPPVESSRVERQLVKRSFAHDGFGLGFELGTQAQAYEEKPRFMKALIALGLSINIIWIGLDEDGAYWWIWA
ncbi:hypothetical protein VitviT2T_018576 [Vitis vinifera]|uniref:Uncharacterized protein n=1 Tax=Vitis vinifera TaxID=29760 RepID=A0ABY9CZV7_VITVI|nr:hypothetical protein VitviT2T_018576 [Vitis vinifera]